MSVVRFFLDDLFTTDSAEYEILHRAVLACKDTPGAIVEIGTRMGGSARIIIDSLVHNSDTDRSMFCIDPYGNIEYISTNFNITQHYPGTPVSGDPTSKDITQSIKLDYSNEMRNKIIPSLYYYAFSKGINFTFFCMEDSEFFTRFSDGVPVYNQVKKLENQYAFVFFDGPHHNEAVELETKFFAERSTIGTVFVADDIWMYNHDLFEKIIFDHGFTVLEKGNIKASYKKTS
jgi:cephalosporin hydroxylase